WDPPDVGKGGVGRIGGSCLVVHRPNVPNPALVEGRVQHPPGGHRSARPKGDARTPARRRSAAMAGDKFGGAFPASTRPTGRGGMLRASSARDVTRGAASCVGSYVGGRWTSGSASFR